MSGHTAAQTEAPPNGRGELGVPLGGSIGSMVGMCGAPIGLLVVSLAAGSIATLWDEALLLLLICFALGLVLLLVMGLGRAHGERTGDRSLELPLLWGSLLTIIGVLFLLGSVWIVPAINAEPSMQKLMGAIGSYRVPHRVSAILVAAGIAVLAKPAHSLLFAKR